MKKLTLFIMLAAFFRLLITSCEKTENLTFTEDLSYELDERASDLWTKLAPVPARFIGVEGMSVASIGNKIIAVCGHDGADTKLTRIYDISTDTWNFGKDAPATSSEGAGVAHGGLFYNIGGRPIAENYFWAYDPVNDVWNTALAPMPTNRIGLAAVVVGNYIYAIGGRTRNAPNGFGKMDVVERYDIDHNMWQTVAPLPSPRSGMGAAVVGNKIFVFGGFDTNGNVLNTVEVYNPNTNKWTSGLAPMPTARGALYAVAKKGGTIYVIGGWDGVYPFNTNIGSTVEAYKVAKNSWKENYSPMPTARSESGAADHGGRIYIVGGATPGGGASVNANEAYKP